MSDMTIKEYIDTLFAVFFYLTISLLTMFTFMGIAYKYTHSNVIAFIAGVMALAIVTAVFAEARKQLE